MDLITNYSETISAYCERFSPNLKIVISKPEWAETSATIGERLGLIKTHKLLFMGLRHEENPSKRGWSIKKLGLTYKYADGTWRSLPLGWWKWYDVWAYIVSNDLPYLSIYDRLDRELGRTTPHLRYWLKRGGVAQPAVKSTLPSLYPRFFKFMKENYPDEI